MKVKKVGTELSRGHLISCGDREYFERDASIYAAPLSSVVMPDGYRCGRFECYAWMWPTLANLIKAKGHI